MHDTMDRYPLILDDGKRNLSARPLALNDCTVRALAIVTGARYNACYDQLKAAGRRSNDGFDLAAYLSKSPVLWGWSARRVRTRKDLTLDRLMASRPHGIIVETEDHVIAVMHGAAHDMIRVPGDSLVYGVWQFSRI